MANRFITIPTEGLPQFDRLYVISDLHIGGRPGFQIFNSAVEMEALISLLIAESATQKVALLINGDFVDFLAEATTKSFDPEGAVGKLNSIVGEPNFVPAWRGLRNFVTKPNCHLVINLGNHDLELALPWVRTRLLEILTEQQISTGNSDSDSKLAHPLDPQNPAKAILDSAAARGRITLTFEGTGFLCGVGKARVLCVHGNEVDDWNVADHEMIRRIGRDVTQGNPVDDWVPNAGSALVVDVMNDIKKQFPFVDLLKPETAAVLRTLAAVRPDLEGKMSSIGPIAVRKLFDGVRRRLGMLGAEEEVQAAAAASGVRTSAEARPEFRGSQSGDDRGASNDKIAFDLLKDAEEMMRQNVDPLKLLGDDRDRQLGFGSAIIARLKGEDTSEVLRRALDFLANDRTFATHDPKDKDFRKLDNQIGNACDFLIAGHTHLQRAIARKAVKGWYFNSGTWARLIKLEPTDLNDPVRFKRVFDAFTAGTMQALDDVPDLVKRILTVVVVRRDNNQTRGELQKVTPDVAPGTYKLEVIDTESTFIKN